MGILRRLRSRASRVTLRINRYDEVKEWEGQPPNQTHDVPCDDEKKEDCDSAGDEETVSTWEDFSRSLNVSLEGDVNDPPAHDSASTPKQGNLQEEDLPATKPARFTFDDTHIGGHDITSRARKRNEVHGAPVVSDSTSVGEQSELTGLPSNSGRGTLVVRTASDGIVRKRPTIMTQAQQKREHRRSSSDDSSRYLHVFHEKLTTLPEDSVLEGTEQSTGDDDAQQETPSTVPSLSVEVPSNDENSLRARWDLALHMMTQMGQRAACPSDFYSGMLTKEDFSSLPLSPEGHVEIAEI